MGCQVLESAKYVKSQVYKMDTAVDIAYACMLAKLPCLFVGNPGTAKSHTFKLIAKLFGERDQEWFYQSITAKTSPEKLFGGIVAEKMLAGIEEYNLSVGAATKLGNIFDELFKSQHPAMMNTLLNYFDEDPTIFSGGKNINPDWEWAFCTTNFEDLPEDLRYDPLWDRMGAKYIVTGLNTTDSKVTLRKALAKKSGQLTSAATSPKLTLNDLKLARNAALAIEINESIINCFYDKVLPILDAYVSQRKIHSIFVGKEGVPSVLQAIAYLTNDTTTEILNHIPYFVWQDTDKLDKMLVDVAKVVTLPVITTYKTVKDQLEIVHRELDNGKFDTYEQAWQSFSIIQESIKQVVSAYSDADKSKVPETLRKEVASLTTLARNRIKSMLNKGLEEVEF